jgi:type VI secretion system secreted protein Hcp
MGVRDGVGKQHGRSRLGTTGRAARGQQGRRASDGEDLRMPIYMQFTRSNGLVIKGNATAPGHEDWIELSSMQLGVNRHVTNPSGRGTDREGSAPATQEIIVTKDEDRASTELFKQSLWGEAAMVQIDFVKDDAGKPVVTMSITLEATQVASYSLSGHGGDGTARPMESLSLNFQRMTYDVPTAKRLIPGARVK